MIFKIFKKSKKQKLCSYPNSTETLWSKGIAMICDHYDLNIDFNISSYSEIKENDLVWVKGHSICRFLREVYPNIQSKFVLVSGDSTISYPKELCIDEFSHCFDNPKLIKWYAQNMDVGDFKHDKFSPLPLGIDFHSQYEKTSWRFDKKMAPLCQESLLKTYIDTDFNAKKELAHAGFQFNNSNRHLVRRDDKITKDRKSIYKALKKNPAVFFQKKRMPRVNLWKQMSEYQFVISPHGSGLDCHRTWEALILGSYVIVEKSVLDPLYKGLPVKILDDFKEISLDNLKKWKEEFRELDYADYSKILTNRYWIDQIRASLN